ncbi:MAG: fluoride efflux transporter CrcB [Amaricoccus sp.]|nr:fluoride efflux transporter CrcB [Amaricoccus sp.]
MSSLLPFAAVALGGALGGAARHVAAMAVTRRTDEGFPWGILVVNLSGAAMVGALAALVPAEHDPLRLLLGTGFLGGYTTVSAFALQTLTLAEEGRPGAAFGYVAASVAGSIAAVAAGFALADLLR